MSLNPRTIHVEPGSELDRILDEAANDVIELERDGELYRVIRILPSALDEEQDGVSLTEDSLFQMFGTAPSVEPTDIAKHKREYIADAVDVHRNP